MKKLLPILIVLLAACLPAAAAPPQAGGPSGYSTQCSSEFQTCTTIAGNSVAFGANGQFVFKTLAATATTIGCDNTTFGSDPIVGTPKACYAKDIALPPPPSSTHSVALSWNAPVGESGVTYNLYRQTCAAPVATGAGSSNGTCPPAANTLMEVMMGTASTAFVDHGVSPGTSYEYWATSYCGDGTVVPCGTMLTGESGKSNTVLVTVAPTKAGTVTIQVK